MNVSTELCLLVLRCILNRKCSFHVVSSVSWFYQEWVLLVSFSTVNNSWSKCYKSMWLTEHLNPELIYDLGMVPVGMKLFITFTYSYVLVLPMGWKSPLCVSPFSKPLGLTTYVDQAYPFISVLFDLWLNVVAYWVPKLIRVFISLNNCVVVEPFRASSGLLTVINHPSDLLFW